MYGSDETSIPQSQQVTHIQAQILERQREVSVDESSLQKNPSNKKQTKEPSSSMTLPTISTKKTLNSSPFSTPTEYNRNISVTSDDVEAAFDSTHDNKTSINKTIDYDIKSATDSFLGLSTIKENLDIDEHTVRSSSSKDPLDEEIDFGNYFNQINQLNETAKSKNTSSGIQQLKSINAPKEQTYVTHAQSDDIQTPSASVSIKMNSTSTSSTILSTKQKYDDINESTDEDVDELIGKFEVNILGKCTHTYIQIMFSSLIS